MSSHEPDALKEEVKEAAQGATEIGQQAALLSRAPAVLAVDGPGPGRRGRGADWHSYDRGDALPGDRPTAGCVARRGRGESFQGGRYGGGDLSQSLAGSLGGSRGQERGVAAPQQRDRVHGLRDLLPASGLPGTLGGGAQLFFCPCHGGAYYADGNVAAGPPQRALQNTRCVPIAGRWRSSQDGFRCPSSRCPAPMKHPSKEEQGYETVPGHLGLA